MYSPPDHQEKLRHTARVALILALAAFGAVLVRNVTDMLRGIAGHTLPTTLQAQAPPPRR